ncbi:hypothetical protein LCGC14_2963030, partial [marine sediment metagenome]
MGLAEFDAIQRRKRGGGEDLSARVSELESLAGESVGGVPKPRGGGFLGVASGVLDLLLRPNFAVAGAAEEAFAPQGRGLGAVPGRVLSELFSGVGSVQGQKEGFGDIFKQAGFGTGGQVNPRIPFTDKTVPITARGTLGLALDIATDPLTYVTFGTSAIAKQALKATAKGARGALREFPLSKLGQRVRGQEIQRLRPVIQKRFTTAGVVSSAEKRSKLAANRLNAMRSSGKFTREQIGRVAEMERAGIAATVSIESNVG